MIFFKARTQYYREQYETCIFMARVSQFVIAALEEENYNHELYDKINKLIAKLDKNKNAAGFIGPQKPNSFIFWLSKKTKKFLHGFLWMKGLYTKNPHKAYQIWCRILAEAGFTDEEIEEIYRVSKLDNYCYDCIGETAWKLLNGKL